MPRGASFISRVSLAAATMHEHGAAAVGQEEQS
jgi:hypothetical protein